MTHVKFFSKFAAAATVTVLLTACANPALFTEQNKAIAGTHWNAPIPVSAGPVIKEAQNWWQAWNDPILFNLIRKAMDANTDVKTALADMKAAAALSDAATTHHANGAQARQRKVTGFRPVLRGPFLWPAETLRHGVRRLAKRWQAL